MASFGGSDTEDPPVPTKPPAGHGLPNPPPDLSAAAAVKTRQDCIDNLKKFVKQRKGLENFYSDKELEDKGEVAEVMVAGLRDLGCGPEIAKQLTLLTLYDVAMLLDDSPSMISEEGGNRKRTLEKVMNEITTVYDLANSDGLLSVRFFNSNFGSSNIQNKHLPWLWKQCQYFGITAIGSALRKKILNRFVWGREMKKPLLVMIITDGAVEGERKSFLKEVILDCVRRLQADSGRGEHAVAFHFSHVGNDEDAKKLLITLDKSKAVGKYIDCLPVTLPLESLEEDKWTILPKLLLGAINEEWDKRDEEFSSKPTDVSDDEEEGEQDTEDVRPEVI